MNTRIFFSLAISLAITQLNISAEELRIGIIGCDTGHATAFTKLINDASNPKHIPGGKVVVAFKGGSPDINQSWSMVDKYTKELQETYGVKIVNTVEELCQQVDVVLLESIDGRPHLAEARPVFKAHKPVFIDKPVGGSLRDVIEINRLAKQYNVPWFSSSAYRYYDCMVDVKNTKVGEIRGAISYGPCELDPHHPDLFWYGIHTTEALYTILGQGCETVVRTTTPDTDEVTGVWKGGKVGTFIGLRNAVTPHKVIVFGTKAIAEQKGDGDYAPLLNQIMTFFKTKVPPVPNDETVEIYAFMEAADESKRTGGKPVKMSEVMAKNSVPDRKERYLRTVAGPNMWSSPTR